MSGASRAGAPDPTGTVPDSELDIVICTYNNAPLLDRVLSSLSAQRGADAPWTVLVVDNNSVDDTRAVVERHVERDDVPGLRSVTEPVQGLTPARLRGVRSTRAPFIAFVDDDCVLDEQWVASAIAFARAHPECGGFGGGVVPTYVEPPPPVLADYGWAFAEQDLGDKPVTADCLVGAGMVVNRAALQESGWITAPYFADRIGAKLVSGGDVEIALRLAGTGRALWYVPACRLQHVIPARRTTIPYLVRMTRGLGVAYSLAHALTWRGSRRSWFRAALQDLVRSLFTAATRMKRVARGRDGSHDALLAVSYEIGRWAGILRVAARLLTNRCAFFGRAPARAQLDGLQDHAVRAA
jgi:glycosyltransferase involved in cell wall biosynthesis